MTFHWNVNLVSKSYQLTKVGRGRAIVKLNILSIALFISDVLLNNSFEVRACSLLSLINLHICKESVASIWTVKVLLLDSPDTSHLLWKAKLKLQKRGMAWFGECMIVDTTGCPKKKRTFRIIILQAYTLEKSDLRCLESDLSRQNAEHCEGSAIAAILNFFHEYAISAIICPLRITLAVLNIQIQKVFCDQRPLQRVECNSLRPVKEDLTTLQCVDVQFSRPAILKFFFILRVEKHTSTFVVVSPPQLQRRFDLFHTFLLLVAQVNQKG